MVFEGDGAGGIKPIKCISWLSCGAYIQPVKDRETAPTGGEFSKWNPVAGAAPPSGC